MLDPRWHFTTWQGRSKVCAMAKREPFVNGHPIQEPGDVWFEFGDDEEDALAKLKGSLPPASEAGLAH